MGEQQIEHRKSRSVLSAHFPVVNVSVLLLNQPNKERQQISSNVFQYTSSFYRFYLSFYSMDTGLLLSFLSLLILLSVIIFVVIVIIIVIIINI